MHPEHRPVDDEPVRSGDRALMAAVAEGSTNALGVLYERYGEAAYRTAYRITGSTADAEDVVHDVFVGLRRAARSYEERGALGGWLKTIVVRTALMRVRQGASRERARLDYVSVDWVPEPTDPVDLLALRAAVRTLPAKLRAVFMLKEVEGYEHSEIAELLGISSVAARVRLHRSWKHLRERMGTS